MKYGNTMEIVKHVAKVSVALWLLIFAISFINIYVDGRSNKPGYLIYDAKMSSIIAAIVPFVVWITSLLNVVIEDDTIYLLVFYKLRYNPQPVDKITLINVGRGLFSIYFEDGSSFRTLGMRISEYFRLVNDIKGLKSIPPKVTSDWLSIN
jgi:hypothetical protein